MLNKLAKNPATTKDEFLSTTGCKEDRYDRYGAAFLEVAKKYVQRSSTTAVSRHAFVPASSLIKPAPKRTF
jgi:hypothetical protein